MRQNKQKTKTAGFKAMLHIYTHVKIPWLWMIASALLTIAMQQITLALVPYTSKIMTGMITGSGFLVSYIVLSVASSIAEEIQGAVNEIAGIRMARNTRNVIWKKMLHLPMSFYSKRDSQELVSRVTNDTTGVYSALSIIMMIFTTANGLATSFHKMYLTYKSLALIMLAGIPVLFLGAWIVGKLQYRVIVIGNAAIAKMTSFFSERLTNVMHIRTCNMEDEEFKKGVEANNARYKAEIKAENSQILIGPVGSFSQTLNQIVLVLVATALVRAGSMKMFQLVNMYNYYILFMSYAYMIIGIWQNLKLAHGASEVLSQIIDEKEENMETGTDDVCGDIVFDSVAFSYDESSSLLKDVSFTIPYGKKTVIIGENGTGKSTVLKLLERFEKVNAGQITIGGQPLENLNLFQLRDKMGYLFQGNQIIKGSIRENIIYGVNRECSEEEIIRAAKDADAYDFIMGKENGFDTIIGHNETKCSGGEMQRIAIARMMLKKPEYLIMDEATSGIDVVYAREIMDRLTELMQGKTIIMISHDIKTMKKAEHLIVLRKGRVEASGTYEEVYENSDLLRQFAEE